MSRHHELLGTWPEQTRAQAIAEWLCLEYVVATETYDRAVCTGSRHGIAYPVTATEQGLISRNALKVSQRVKTIAALLELDVADMNDGRHAVDGMHLNSFDDEVAALAHARERLHRFDVDHVEWIARAERMIP